MSEAPTETAPSLRRSWYWYDWANSAFYTTSITVLFGPYLTAVATEAACPGLAEGASCQTNLSLFGIPIAPGSVAPYTVTVATLISAVLLLFVGALTDRTRRPIKLLGLFAIIGSVAGMLMGTVAGTAWQWGVLLLVISLLAYGASMVVYDAILCRIAAPEERDRVSSRGWAMGYLGGGLMLALTFVALASGNEANTGTIVRWALFAAGAWWLLFSIIPVVGLWRLRNPERPLSTRGKTPGSLSQLKATFTQLRALPHTMTFLVAYLLFNDGIQTVIAQSSLYGQRELGFDQTTMLAIFLLVQFIAFGGALGFGWLASRWGAHRTILAGLCVWILIVIGGYFMPAKQLAALVIFATLVGLVMGGTQALTRSLYSQLIPRAREAEFFSLYQAMERGTSWFGALTFGLIYQFSGSYRPSLLALMVFFILGALLLMRVNVKQGIIDAGNADSALSPN